MIRNYDFVFEKTKDEFKIIKIYKEDKKVYIGSKYKMGDKIDEFINTINKEAKEDSIFVIFGIGSGECLKRLNNLYPKSNIIIFEPNIKLINYIKENPGEYSFLQKENIYLIDSEKQDLKEALGSIISEYDIVKIIYGCILNYDKIYDEEFYQFTKILKDFLSDKVIYRNTSIVFSEIWFKTLINNFKYIIDSTYVDMYKNKYKDVPAIIVSAGPSLSKNVDELKKLNKDMLILSGGRTLKPLLERGINPDLIGVVDPGYASYRLVQGYIDKVDKPLLFYEGTNSEVVRQHKGNKIIFTQADLIKEIFDENITSLIGGGSIAHTLTMMAILLGCNPIIFIGQDLAYTEQKFHADIAVNQFNNIKENQVDEKENEIYVEDINGKMIRTSAVLDSFKRELEQIIRTNEKTLFIDATEGGAKIEGTNLMNLKDVIDKYKLKDKITELDNKINYTIDKKTVKKNIISILENSIIASDFIENRCKSTVKILGDLQVQYELGNNTKINRDLRKLDEIDKQIKEKCKELDILGNLIYPIIYFILSSSKAQNNKDIIKKNKFLYESILEKVQYAKLPMKDVLSEIKNMEI